MFFLKWNSKLSIISTAFLMVVFFSACTSSKFTPPTPVDTSGGTTIGVIGGGASAAAAPSSLVAFPNSSQSILLTWTDNSTDETEFRIYRSNSATGTFTQIGTTDVNMNRFTDTQLFPNTTYYYQVTASKTGVGETSASSANGTTFSGDWLSVSGSATGTGLSATAAAQSSAPSLASDSLGRTLVVWQEAVNGQDQIYAKFFDPNLFTSAGVLVGWRPLIVNSVLLSSGTNTAGDRFNSISYDTVQYSDQGKGISIAAGSAQEPVVVYNNTGDEFDVFWQEKRSGSYKIFGRRIKIPGFNTLSGASGAFYAQMSDSSITVNTAGGGITNDFADDNYTTVASTWILSGNSAAINSIRPQAAVSSGLRDTWVVFQNFDSGAAPLTWQTYGVRNTMAAIAAYPAIDTSPAAAAPVVASMDNAAVSNAATGISASAVAGEHAIYPTVTVANNTGNNNIYVGYQQYVSATTQWDIQVKACTGDGAGATCVGAGANDFQAAVAVTANVGDSQHPKMATDSSGIPYIAWDDNSNSSNYDIYVQQGTVNTTPVFTTIDDGAISSGDTATGGISATVGVSAFPSIALDATTIYVAWQDNFTNTGRNNVYVKMYDTSTPSEPDVWKGMAASDESTGISLNSASTVSAFLPTLRVNSGGSVDVVWSQLTSTIFQDIYLKRY